MKLKLTNCYSSITHAQTKNKDDPDYGSDGALKTKLKSRSQAEWSDKSTERFRLKANNDGAEQSSGDRLFHSIVNRKSKQFLPHLEPLNGTTRLPEAIPHGCCNSKNP